MEWLDRSREIALIIAAFASLMSMLFGLGMVYHILTKKGASFGTNSTHVVALVLFIPALVLLAITVDFSSEALSALLGTVAGYALTRPDEKPKDRQTRPSTQKQKPSKKVSTADNHSTENSPADQ